MYVCMYVYMYILFMHDMYENTHPMEKAMYKCNILHCFKCILFKVDCNWFIYLASLVLLVFATIPLLTSKNLDQIKKNCSVYIEEHAILLKS